jgi:hypothetical protein
MGVLGLGGQKRNCSEVNLERLKPNLAVRVPSSFPYDLKELQ